MAQSANLTSIAALGALGIGGFLLWRKFEDDKAADAVAASGGVYPSYVAPMTGAHDPVTGAPTYGQPVLQPPIYVGPQPSNLNPGALVGGVVGTCMTRKPTWTQSQCQTRLDTLYSAYQTAKARAASDAAAGDAAGAAKWQQALEGHRVDYYNLTGQTLA